MGATPPRTMLQNSPKVLEQFHAINLRREDLEKYYDLYNVILESKKLPKGSATLEIIHIFQYFQVHITPFLRRFFNRKDSNLNSIRFPEFVYFLWEFCTMEKSELGRIYKINMLLYRFLIYLRQCRFAFTNMRIGPSKSKLKLDSIPRYLIIICASLRGNVTGEKLRLMIKEIYASTLQYDSSNHDK